MALPLSLITTNAQLRPAAPCTPPPGCAPAHHVRSSCCFSQAHNKPKKFFSKPQQTKKVIISQIILQRKGCGRAHAVGGGRMLWEGGATCAAQVQALQRGTMHAVAWRRPAQAEERKTWVQCKRQEKFSRELVAIAHQHGYAPTRTRSSTWPRRLTCCRRAGAAPVTSA